MLISASSKFSWATIGTIAACVWVAEAATPNEQIPLTCRQFEALFPEAIKYEQSSYYTLKIEESAVVCFYNSKQQLSHAIVLSKANQNAEKLAEFLHMSYKPNGTVMQSRKRTMLLYNDSALSSDFSYFPFDSSTLLSLLVRKGNEQENTCRFVNWATRGITFSFSTPQFGSISVVFSPQNNEIYNLLLDAEDDNSQALAAAHFFCTAVLGFSYLRKSSAKTARELKKEYELKALYFSDGLNGIHLGKNKRGFYIVGKENNTGQLSDIPNVPIMPIPNSSCTWPEKSPNPATTEATQRPAKNPAPNPTQPPPELIPISERKIEIPLTPADALQQYIKRLRSLGN